MKIYTIAAIYHRYSRVCRTTRLRDKTLWSSGPINGL